MNEKVRSFLKFVIGSAEFKKHPGLWIQSSFFYILPSCQNSADWVKKIIKQLIGKFILICKRNWNLKWDKELCIGIGYWSVHHSSWATYLHMTFLVFPFSTDLLLFRCFSDHGFSAFCKCWYVGMVALWEAASIRWIKWWEDSRIYYQEWSLLFIV